MLEVIEVQKRPDDGYDDDDDDVGLPCTLAVAWPHCVSVPPPRPCRARVTEQKRGACETDEQEDKYTTTSSKKALKSCLNLANLLMFTFPCEVLLYILGMLYP